MAASKLLALEPPGWPQNHGDMHWAYLVTLQLGDYSGVIAFHLEILNSKLIDFCRESFKNWNLFSVNVAMAGTGLYQLTRKMKHDYFSEREAAVERD